MGSVIQYDPAENILNIGGRDIGHYSSGSFIEITPGGDLSSIEKGPSGDVIVNRKNETTAELKVTVLKGSATAKFLGGLFFAWRQKLPMVSPITPLGVLMQMKNLGSGSIANGTNLTPKAEPPMVGADDGGSLAFTFWVFNYKPLHNGG